MNRAHVGAAARGFSLVEVMVAVVIICVGLLGVAKMQALSLSNTTTARLRSLAAFEAEGLAAEMHANRVYWTTPSTTTTVTSNPLTITTTDAMGGIATTDLGNLTACVGVSGAVATCGGANGANMAAFDLARWVTSLSALLPNPSATITCNALTAPVNCTIQISWTEQAVASSNLGTNVAGAQNLQNPTYTLYVEP